MAGLCTRKDIMENPILIGYSLSEVKMFYIDKSAYDNMMFRTSIIKTPEDGHLVVSNVCVCESNAGYYVGRYCAEYIGDGMWLPQPYERLSGYYITKEGASEELNNV